MAAAAVAAAWRNCGPALDTDSEPMVAPSTLPSPLTGNPVIYDMRTGKPKNRSESEFRQFLDEYNGRLASNEEKFSGKKKAAPAIIKKISVGNFLPALIFAPLIAFIVEKFS